MLTNNKEKNVKTKKIKLDRNIFLPIELLIEIINYLNNPFDLYNYSIVNRTFNNAILSVKNLNISLTNNTENNYLNLLQLKNLKDLTIYYFNDYHLLYFKSISKLNSLNNLNIYCHLLISNDFVSVLSTFTNITKLSLENSSEELNLTDKSLPYKEQSIFKTYPLKSCPSYLSLPYVFRNMFNPPILRLERLLYSINILKYLVENKKHLNLKILKINAQVIHEVFFQYLLQLPSLEELYFLGNVRIDGNSFLNLFKELAKSHSQLKIFGLVINDKEINGNTVEIIVKNYYSE